MAEYLIQDVTLMNIANVIKAKTGKSDAILVSDFASEIGSIQAFEAELPVMDSAYPKDVTLTVIKGNTVSATFDAVFTSHGKPANYTYQWYVDGVAVDGANNAVYTMSVSETVNQSVYCSITNEAGTVNTRTATLKVTQYYTPVLNTSYPANVTVSNGSTTSATFKVEIATAGVPASYTYQWYVDGNAVSGATSSSYTKSGLTKKATYTVYCKVTNEVGTVQSRTATLTVGHTFLYNKGDACASIHGGWVASTRWYTTNAKTPTLTMGTSTMNAKITGTTKNYQSGIIETGTGINLTGYSTLTFVVTAMSASNKYGEAYFLLGVPNTNSGTISQSASTVKKVTTFQAGTYTVDISALSGTRDVFVGIRTDQGDENTSSITFSKIYLT